jgi:broad specificity phosphatase PhoE
VYSEDRKSKGAVETRLILIRHGETDWNVARRYFGVSDVPLNDNGRRLAEETARALFSESISAVYTSDLSRAAETARIIAAERNLLVFEDVRLREMDFGPFEGMTYDEMMTRKRPAAVAWIDDPFTCTLPGAEPFDKLKGRVESFLSDLLQHRSGESVVVVTHGGPFRVFWALISRKSHSEARALQIPPGFRQTFFIQGPPGEPRRR